jgi:hypothetical protein
VSSATGGVPERILLESHGVWLEVEVQDPELLPEVERILPPGWRAVREFPEDGHLTIGRNGDGLYRVTVDGGVMIDGVPAELAVQVLDAQLRAKIAVTAPDLIFVHAGVVAVDGRAIVLPGMSFSGKTTLVAALIAAGATYLSDEFAVLDAEGLVHPYAKPLSIRGDGERRGDLTAVDVLGGQAATEPVRVALVAALTYRSGAEWAPRELTRGAGALALLGNTVPARTRPAQVLAATSRAVANARVIEGDRSEAGVTARLLLDELQRS